ncbi:MAG TPA: hypothetical protein VF747_16235, partial [Blastocatellia bacterium]
MINTECKRYGCIKNLLACFANCRYSTRCEDLRNEIIDKTELASTDINKYLSERGRTPITIQLMKRGLKFADVLDRPPALSRKVSTPAKVKIPTQKPQPVKIKKRAASRIDSAKQLATVLTKKREPAVMPRRLKKELNPLVIEKEQISNPPVQVQESNGNNRAKIARPVRSKKRKSPSSSRSA